MISQTCKTAIKAVIFLSSISSEGKKAGKKEIASKIDASEHTVGKVLQVLVKQGIINSMKGPSGGFFMEEDQFDLPLIKIVNTVDGKGVFNECGLGLKQCSDTHPCPIHHEYKEGRDLIKKLFMEKKISDLTQPMSEGLVHLIIN